MKKILCSLVLATAILLGTASAFANNTQYYDIKSNGTSTTKRCQCKKYFENHLGLTQEQIKTLQYMREMKKEGKSCCPCGKNRYY